jgi:hypothetical protein
MNLVSVSLSTYTSQGIERIAKVIQATLRVRGWTERELTRAIQDRAKNLQDPSLSLSAGTVNRYASLPPVVKRPEDRPLIAIAPFIFRVVRIDGDRVDLDTSCTYEDNWRDFARIGTEDYSASLPIAGSSFSHNNRLRVKEFAVPKEVGRGAGAVGRLIRSEMIDRGLNPDLEADFREFAMNFPANDENDIAHLRDLVQGTVEFARNDLIGFLALAIRLFTNNPQFTTEYLAAVNQPAELGDDSKNGNSERERSAS